MNSLLLSSALVVCLVASAMGASIGGHYSESKEDCENRSVEKVEEYRATMQHYLMKKSNYMASMWDAIYSTKITDREVFENLETQLKKVVTEVQVDGKSCLDEAEQWGKSTLKGSCHLAIDKWSVNYQDEQDVEDRLRKCFVSSLQRLTNEVEKLIPADLKN